MNAFHQLPLSLKALILNTFLVSFGSFMVTPFLAIYLTGSIGMELKTVGILVAIATFVQFGGGIIGGMVAEQFSLKSTMVASMALRTCGLLLLALASTFPTVVVPAVLMVAAAPALYLPANRAYVILSVPKNLRPLFLSISNAALNAGMALGPLVAASFITHQPSTLFFALALLFALLTGLHLLTIRHLEIPKTHGTFKLGQFCATIQKVWHPVSFNILTFYIYFFFQNFMGLYVAEIVGLRIFSWVMALNFIMMFVLQPIAARQIAKAPYRHVLLVGFTLLGTGLLIIAAANTMALFVGTAVMTLGQMMLFLRGDLEVVDRLPHTPAMAFGIQRLAAGIGGLFSGVAGGSMFDYWKQAGSPGVFWIVVSSQCFLALLLSMVFSLSRKISYEKQVT